MDKDIFLLRLHEKWKCSLTFGWIPITGDQSFLNTEIYQSEYLNHYFGEIKAAIKNIYDLTLLFELREDGQFEVLDIDQCRFTYDGNEYIYSDKELNFLLYFLHEGTTTIGGELLLNEIHKIWPEYSNHIWKSN